MSKAYFIFTKYANSFSVYVKNLEQLSVEEIQKIQSFVSFRKGVFDFNTYSFSIQKNIEFEEFCKLIEQSNIKAQCAEHFFEKKEQARVGFGQYKGMQYNELPDSYMLWLKNNYRGYERDVVDKELQRRKL